MDDTQYINTTLLLLLAFLPNYTGSLIGCKLGRLLQSSHPTLKFMYLILMVFSCFIITDNKDIHPLKLLLNSFIVVFIFNLFNRQKTYTLIPALILLISILFVNKLKRYVEEHSKRKEHLELLKMLEKTMLITICIILSTGTALYFIEKQQEYTTNFDYLTFFIGNEACKNN